MMNRNSPLFAAYACYMAMCKTYGIMSKQAIDAFTEYNKLKRMES